MNVQWRRQRDQQRKRRNIATGTAGKKLTLVAMLLAVLLLPGCVTETSGGFNAKRSDADALRDYLQLATGYLEQNDIANSKRHLANAAAIDPDSSGIHAIWGLVYSREGETRLSDESFQRALRLDASNSKARNNYAAYLFANSRFEEAYTELSRVVEDTGYEARSQAFENLGLAALRLNRVDAAENAFGRALQLNPNQLRSSLELVTLNLAKNNVQQAVVYYRNYLTLQQLYTIPHTARSLWVGIQLEAALGNRGNVEAYGQQLEANFASAPEFQLYKQLLDTLK
jgi:type IV pilus assembly protein PilF